MSSTDNIQAFKFDKILWTIVVFLMIAGVVANFYFNSIVWPLRLSGWIFLISAMGFFAFKTKHGKLLWKFAKEAKIELRKVVWPTKDETIRTTMIIAFLVVVMAIILWFVDTLLLMAVNWLAG